MYLHILHKKINCLTREFINLLLNYGTTPNLVWSLFYIEQNEIRLVAVVQHKSMVILTLSNRLAWKEMTGDNRDPWQASTRHA